MPALRTKSPERTQDDRRSGFRIPAANSPVAITQLREGFAVNAAYDRAFALGFPYVVCLTSEGLAPEEQAARAGALRLDTFIDSGVARRALRLIAKQGFTWPPQGIRLTPAGKKLVRRGALGQTRDHASFSR